MSWVDRVHEAAAQLHETAAKAQVKLALVKLLLLQNDVEGALRELEDVDATFGLRERVLREGGKHA